MKLAEIQRNLKAPKGQFNAFGKYKYRSAEDILEAVKPLLNGEATILLSDDLVLIGDRYYIKATATFKSKEEEISVTAFAREEESKKGMDGAQVTGASSSYSRKYALNGLLLIDDTKDADVTNDHKVDAESLKNQLISKMKSYTDPSKLDSEKQKIRDEYVKLGLQKKEATEIVAEYINGL